MVHYFIIYEFGSLLPPFILLVRSSYDLLLGSVEHINMVLNAVSVVGQNALSTLFNDLSGGPSCRNLCWLAFNFISRLSKTCCCRLFSVSLRLSRRPGTHSCGVMLRRDDELLVFSILIRIFVRLIAAGFSFHQGVGVIVGLWHR